MQPLDTSRNRPTRLWLGFTLCALGVICVAPACAMTPLAPAQVDYPTLEPDDADAPADPEPAAESPRETTPSDTVRAWIPVDVDLGDPRDITELTVRIHIDAPYRLPNGPNHRVESLPYELSEITVRAAPGAEVSADERAEALAATSQLDTGDERLRARAAAAIDGAAGDRERVHRLVRWVYANVAYAHADEQLASAVLASGEGDCSELSLLFVAMARAVEIPARRVVGLAYTYEGGQPAFGYHAWAEVAIDGRWVQVDPTWNETLVDATHIKLVEGDSNAWHAAAGKIQLWIGAFDRRPTAGDVDPARVAAELPIYLQPRR